MSPGQGTKLALEKWNLIENHNIKIKLTQKLYTESIRHVNITKPIIFRIAINLASVVVLYVHIFYTSVLSL